MNTDHTLNLQAICRYLTRRDSIFLFLALSLLFAVVVVVFLQPVGLLTNTMQLSSLAPLTQITLISVAGYLVVLISRLILYRVNRRKEMSLLGCGIWMSVELVLCVAIAVVIAWLVSGCGRLSLGALAGDMLLGNVIIFLIPNIVAFQEFRIHELKDLLRKQSMLLPEGGPSAAALADQHINFYDKGGRLTLSTRCGNVLYIEAADNYANIHYLNEGKEDTFILHNTLKDMEKDYSGVGLLRCHRGYMVNVWNVKLMRKERGSLLLELNQTTKTIPVSKSYTDSVTRFFSDNAITPLPAES